jgi:hypothetical protein
MKYVAPALLCALAIALVLAPKATIVLGWGADKQHQQHLAVPVNFVVAGLLVVVAAVVAVRRRHPIAR